MEELFFDIYERRSNPEDYSADSNESTNTKPKQKEKECLSMPQNTVVKN